MKTNREGEQEESFRTNQNSKIKPTSQQQIKDKTRQVSFIANSEMQSFISGQPSVQGEEGDGLPQQSNELVEFGWNMIKVNSQPASVSRLSILLDL